MDNLAVRHRSQADLATVTVVQHGQKSRWKTSVRDKKSTGLFAGDLPALNNRRYSPKSRIELLQIFIDDSGSFDWTTPDVSLFCGVTVPDRERDALFDRFARWRRTIIRHSNRELKGAELTDGQLHSFTTKVLPTHQRDFWLTVVGIDTRQTRKVHVEKLREQAVAISERSAEIMAQHQNAKMQEQYRQMTGWMRSRSPQNLLWIIGVEAVIIDSLQHSIIRLMEPEDDAEFREMRIFIDESFIHREEHVRFWREWLRNGLAKSSRTELLHLPDTWRKRGHPFIRAYSIYPGILDLNYLYWRRMGFFRSRNFVGLQIADVCAHAICRYHRGNGATAAYRQLRPRIVGRDGAEIHNIVVNEKSLHTDNPKDHVGIFDPAEIRRRADEIRRQRPS